MSTITQTIPSPMSVEVEAAPKETSLWGQPRNVPKRKFIGECICGGPVTADEMDSEDESICYKQKDVKQVGYITSTSNRELTSYTVSSCMCRY